MEAAIFIFMSVYSVRELCLVKIDYYQENRKIYYFYYSGKNYICSIYHNIKFQIKLIDNNYLSYVPDYFQGAFGVNSPIIT